MIARKMFIFSLSRPPSNLLLSLLVGIMNWASSSVIVRVIDSALGSFKHQRIDQLQHLPSLPGGRSLHLLAKAIRHVESRARSAFRSLFRFIFRDDVPFIGLGRQVRVFVGRLTGGVWSSTLIWAARGPRSLTTGDCTV